MFLFRKNKEKLQYIEISKERYVYYLTYSLFVSKFGHNRVKNTSKLEKKNVSSK